MNTTEIRELNVAELDLVSGGKVFTRSIAGFTFTYDDKTRETTVSAGDVSVTTGPGFVSTSSPITPDDLP